MGVSPSYTMKSAMRPRCRILLVIMLLVFTLYLAQGDNNSANSSYSNKFKLNELNSGHAVIQIISILISGLFVGWQIRSAKKREIEFKIHQQRKEIYSKLVRIFIQILVASRNSDNNFDPTSDLPFGQEEWLDAQLGLSMYASRDVLNAYNEFIKTTQVDKIAGLRKFGELILKMRAEVGLDDSNISSRQILSNFITDINDSSYDKYFW